MRITRLVWDDETADHVARHGVDPEEAEEVCLGRPYVLRARGGRYIVLGTNSSRYITVIVAPLGGGNLKLITARPMTDEERRRYRDR